MNSLRRYTPLILLLVFIMSCGSFGANPTPASEIEPTATENLSSPPSPPTETVENTSALSVEFVWSFKGGDTPFFYPSGIAIDSQGKLYVSDARNGRIVKVDPDGQFVSQFGSNGSAQGQFTTPAGLALDSQDNIYVTDSGNDRVQKFDSSGNFLKLWGGSGTAEGQFDEPYNISVDSQDQVFVVDRKNFRIQKFDKDGGFLSAWGGQGDQDGQFVNIGSVAVNAEGNVFVNDLENNRVTISKFDNAGTFLEKWDALTCAFPRQTASPAEIGGPGGMWFDPQGNLYVADLAWSRICNFDPTGTSLGGWGEKGIEPGQLLSPVGIVGDGAGNIYVLDYSSGQVQKFSVK